MEMAVIYCQPSDSPSFEALTGGRHAQERVARSPDCVGAVLPSACSQESKPKATATILNNENVHRAMLALLGAVGNLEGAIDGFSNTNWREVVPEVESAASDVRMLPTR